MNDRPDTNPKQDGLLLVNFAKGCLAARAVAEVLKQNELRVVLAESCTCGMAAALLGSVPGISQYFCGSAVTYRVPTKTQWLGLDRERIEIVSAESLETTREMVLGVLAETSEADYSAAITGDLGPDADNKDGVIYICVAKRGSGLEIVRQATATLNSHRRVSRQIEAATVLLNTLEQELQSEKCVDKSIRKTV